MDTEPRRNLILPLAVTLMVLVALTVIGALWLIARPETADSNRQVVGEQTEQQLTKSVEDAADIVTPPPSRRTELTITVAQGQLDIMADTVAAAADRFGGSATKQLSGSHHIDVLVELPAHREMEFRRVIDAIKGRPRDYPLSDAANRPSSNRKSFVVQILEPATPQN